MGHALVDGYMTDPNESAAIRTPDQQSVWKDKINGLFKKNLN
jgi:hypothetical protein